MYEWQEANELMEHLEIAEVLLRNFGNQDVRNMSERWPLPAPPDETLYLFLRPAGNCFNTAVLFVFYPALNAQFVGLLFSRLTVKDALYFTFYNEMNGRHGSGSWK